LNFVRKYIEIIKGLVNWNRKKRVFWKEYEKFLSLAELTEGRFVLNKKDCQLMLYDKTEYTSFDRQYVYHTAWAARVLSVTQPETHVDISSSLYFCAMVSAFIPVKFYDYRPANLSLSGLEEYSSNLLHLDFADNSISSLSCMHTIEHIGLGRYGDKLNYDGDIKAMKELSRVLAPNGDLLIVVPIGKKNKLCFNAHRIYTKEQILSIFAKLGVQLKEFVLIPEDQADGGLVTNPDKEIIEKNSYACGCFWFKK
jgi:hypothetical protein